MGLRRAPSLGAVFAIGMAVWLLLAWLPTAGAHYAPWPLLIALKLIPGYRSWALRKPTSLLPFAPLTRLIALALIGLNLFGVFMLVKFCGIWIVNYDVLSYHIPLARDFLEGRSLLNPRPIFYGYLPQGGPILEAPFLTDSLGGSAGPGLNFFLAACLLAGADSAGRCAAWLGARRTGRMAASAIYLFHPMLTGAFINALTEPILALFSVAALEMTLAAFSRRASWYQGALAGLLAGSAVAVKLSAAGTAAIPLAIIAGAFAFGMGKSRKGMRTLLLFAAGGFLATAPWLARAMALGGHPFFPLRGESPDWSEEQANFVVEQHNPQSVFSLKYWGDFLGEAGVFGYSFGPVSFLLLAAIGSLALLPWRPILPILCAVVSAYLSYLTVDLNPARFMAPAVVLLIPGAAAALTRNLALRKGRIILGAGALLFTLTANLPLNPFTFPAIYRPDERRILQESEEAMRLIEVASENHKRTGGLLLLFEARAGLFPASVTYNTVWDKPPWAELLLQAKDSEDYARRLSDAGFHRIFVNEAEWTRLADFYGGEWKGTSRRLHGQIGVYTGLPQSELLAILGAYAPFRAAGFEQRELTILSDFLITRRMRTMYFTAAGPGSEIWYARVREDSL